MTAEISVALAFSAGLLGALHCLGMCGGLAGGYFAQRRSAPRLATQLGYHSARILMYALLGMGGALLGRVLVQSGIVGKAQGIIMILAGLIIVALGSRMALGRADRARTSSDDRSSRSRLVRLEWPERATMTSRGPLLFGLINGLVPCSLVFSVAIKAAATADPARAGLLMLAFGLGTLPMMAAITWTGAVVGERVSGWVERIGGGVVVALGLWTLYEGYVFFDIMRGLANW